MRKHYRNKANKKGNELKKIKMRISQLEQKKSEATDAAQDAQTQMVLSTLRDQR